MASAIWLRTILIVRKETRCRHMGYSFQLTARVLLYAPSHRQDSTYHSLCYTSRRSLAGSRNSFVCISAQSCLHLRDKNAFCLASCWVLMVDCSRQYKFLLQSLFSYSHVRCLLVSVNNCTLLYGSFVVLLS